MNEKPTVIQFTDRQLHVIECWANFGSVTEASRVLGISENTFQTHLKRLRTKVAVSRTVDVYRYMLYNGHIRLPDRDQPSRDVAGLHV